MNYQSTFLWEKGSIKAYNPVSLVLQQATICKQSILLACVCESDKEGENGVLESGYFTESLVEWFHRDLVKRLEKGALGKEVEKGLQKEVERICKELEIHAVKRNLTAKMHCMGLLLVENRFWMFSQGRVQAYLINRRFNKKNMCLIAGEKKEEELLWQNGSIQKHLGILICTSGLLSYMEMEEATEVLSLEGELSEERLQKRLQELWKENVQRGESASVGAVYIRT